MTAHRDGFERLVRAGDQWLVDGHALCDGDLIELLEFGHWRRCTFRVFAGGIPWGEQASGHQSSGLTRLDMPGTLVRRCT